MQFEPYSIVCRSKPTIFFIVISVFTNFQLLISHPYTSYPELEGF